MLTRFREDFFSELGSEVRIYKHIPTFDTALGRIEMIYIRPNSTLLKKRSANQPDCQPDFQPDCIKGGIFYTPKKFIGSLQLQRLGFF